MLSYEAKPPLTVDFFLEECQRLLDASDYTLIYALLTEDDPPLKTHNALVAAWVQFNRQLRNELVWFRAGRLNKDPLLFMRGERSADPFLIDKIHQAAKAANPLEVQKAIDKIIWQFLDELAVGQYFNVEFLCVYGLKLKMLHKNQEYHSPKGHEVFQGLQNFERGQELFVAAANN